ncbi:extracellular solute-binding protein [Haloplasma contractile]|uniref:Trehalose-maltose binding protein n=1 Tax=Haloplasma contractile SSD-17B TaxID=1033810 RepID=F7PVB2_9MOLU|nr:extracellular solute-binding protein [Haloplasma contractile]ERJ12923.1 Trehalose-maltose binding protein [Haloplasma contractile SSD-17B]
MKKLFSMITMLALIVILSACGEKEEVIKFAVQEDSTDALNTLVEEFNKKDNGYKVEIVKMTNDSAQMRDQIVTSLSSKSDEYDVISMDVVWAGQFAAAGYLEPLDPLMTEENWSASDFNAGSMASGKYSGKHYAMPYFPDLGFLYYRTDIVSDTDATKLKSGNYTWDELLTMAETYKGQENTEYGIVYQSKQYEGLVCNLNEFSANWTDVQGGLETMKAFTDSTATPDNILTYTEGETHNAFNSGKTVFARNWPYMNGMIAEGDKDVSSDQVGYAPLPNGGTVGGWLVGISKYTDVSDGAKAFVKFLAGPEGQKINATVGGYLPGYNDLLNDQDVKDANALLTDEGFQNALKNTIARPVVAEYADVSDEIQINAHKYLSGDETLVNAKNAIETALD